MMVFLNRDVDFPHKFTFIKSIWIKNNLDRSNFYLCTSEL